MRSVGDPVDERAAAASAGDDGGSMPDARAQPALGGRACVLRRDRGVTKRFGGLVAVNDIDFTIPSGSIVSLIGPNGAGKTTFFNIIAGIYDPTAGRSSSVDGR